MRGTPSSCRRSTSVKRCRATRGRDGRRTCDHRSSVLTPSLATRYGGDPLSIDLGDGWLSGPQLATLRQQPFVRSVRRTDEGLTVAVDDAAADLGRLQQYFATAGVGVKQVTPMEPTFDEMFVLIIEANTSASERAES